MKVLEYPELSLRSYSRNEGDENLELTPCQAQIASSYLVLPCCSLRTAYAAAYIPSSSYEALHFNSVKVSIDTKKAIALALSWLHDAEAG